jgi:hypothetical protein
LPDEAARGLPVERRGALSELLGNLNRNHALQLFGELFLELPGQPGKESVSHTVLSWRLFCWSARCRQVVQSASSF